MRALCLIMVKPGTIDKVTELLSKKRKMAKEVLPVLVEQMSVFLCMVLSTISTSLLWILKRSMI